MDRNRLAVEHLSLADGLAGKHARRSGAEFDECRGIARLKLVECSRRFKPGNGAPFSAFAHRRIAGALIDADRKRTAHRSESGRNIEAREQLPADQPSFEPSPFEQAAASELWRFVDRLPRTERIAIRMRFIGNAKLHEIGSHLGVTESRACQLVSAGLKTLHNLCAYR